MAAAAGAPVDQTDGDAGATSAHADGSATPGPDPQRRARLPRTSHPDRSGGRRSRPSCSTRWRSRWRVARSSFSAGGALGRGLHLGLDRGRAGSGSAASRGIARRDGEIQDRATARLGHDVDRVASRPRPRPSDQARGRSAGTHPGSAGRSRWAGERSRWSRSTDWGRCRGGPGQPLVGGSGGDADDDRIAAAPRSRWGHKGEMVARGGLQSGCPRDPHRLAAA